MQLLPEPEWADAQASCLGCGYSLEGLVPPTVCPECGLPYSGRQLVVHGLADARSTMAPWRIVVVVIVTVLLMFGGPQLLLLLGIFTSWWLVLGVLIAGVTGFVFFLRSSPGSYGGTARIVFDHAGIAVLPLALKHQRKVGERWAVCVFTRFERVELRQISDTWAKVKICKPDGGTLFSGGMQLPRHRENEIRQSLNWIIAGNPMTPPPLPAQGGSVGMEGGAVFRPGRGFYTPPV